MIDCDGVKKRLPRLGGHPGRGSRRFWRAARCQGRRVDLLWSLFRFKSAKSLRYNFLAPVCRTCSFASSQVDSVLDLSEIESASPFEFITQTFAVFASRRHAKRTQMTCAPRNAWYRDAREGRRVRAWPCAKHATQRYAGNARAAKCAARGCGLGEGCTNGRARSMWRRDAQAMRGSRCAWLGQCGRIASGVGVPHGARAWGAAMGHVARRGAALRAAGC